MRRIRPRLLVPFTGLWAGLSERERLLLKLLGLSFAFVVTLVVVYLRGRRLDALRARTDRVRGALELLARKGEAYKERRSRADRAAKKFSDKPLLFSSHLEAVAAKVPGVEIRNQEEQPPVEVGSGVRKRSIEFDIRSVPYATLVEFLAQAEVAPGHTVMVDGLRIRSASAEEDRLHAAVRLSTWERVASAGGKEGAAP